MTNPSSPEPQNPIPERRRRPATGVTFDEMIAIIVAFSTIGAILFWSMGGKNSKLASNFGLGGGTNLLSSNQTTNTGLGFGNVLSDDSSKKKGALGDRNLEAENRQLAAKLKGQDKPVAYIPPNKTVKLPAKAEKQAFTLDSGAKLVPLAGVAAIPALTRKPKADVTNKDPAPEKPEMTETAKAKPTPSAPKTTEMPKDVVPDYWAFPFVKQMRDKGLVPELAKNQEFDPDALITRASMATLVSQAFADQPKVKNAKKFNDVSNQNEIAEDVDKAVSIDFMQGYSNTEFKPLENIPRYQVLVTLATGLGLEPPQDVEKSLQQFGDNSNIPDWARDQVAAATEAGLVVNPPGADKSTLVPERSATRAEVAAMIHQALVKNGKLESIKSEYIVEP